MSLRVQLLLLSVLTLALPWAGCRYAGEMESVLREGEQQALLATATTLANVVSADPDLLSPSVEPFPPFDPAIGDLYAYRLQTPPLLDGYADEWGLPETAYATAVGRKPRFEARYAAGTDGHHLYLVIQVADSKVILEPTADTRLDPEERADHVWVAVQRAAGAIERYLFATSAPGLISARRPVVSEFGERGEVAEPRIQAYWQEEKAGYRLEIRIPLELAGPRIGFEAVDVSGNGAEAARVGTLDAADRRPRGRVMLPARDLERQLSGLLPRGTRALVSNANGWVMAEAGALEAGDRLDSNLAPAEWIQAMYRRLLERERTELPSRPFEAGRLSGPHAIAALSGTTGAAWFRVADEHRSILAVAAPIRAQDAMEPERVGAIVLEQTGERLLVLRDRALTGFLNLTLLVSAIAMLAMFGFATVLAVRLGRLKRAAENALGDDGRLDTSIPGMHARDELGDLARSFAALLERLHDYTTYLRTLAGKLSHELRTPLAIVRSSIDNLEMENDKFGEAASVYVDRAREGTTRLQGIISAMGAATRTEEAIQQAERVTFDLRQLVASTTAAYADTFQDRHVEATLPPDRLDFHGAPDLIVQMLDKLVDNAVDFSIAGSKIEVEMTMAGDDVVLAVLNEGPPIPQEVQHRLFEAMFEFRRSDSDERPHFGLGLYIVRLIAEFHNTRSHRGSVFAENLHDPRRVRIGVTFKGSRTARPDEM